MAYDSTRNYAQEIQDLIKAGGDPAKVNQLLNERLEKQQSMDTGYSTYDDVYREAMDYMAGKGYTTQASANVDYAEIANQIIADQTNRNVSGSYADDRSWADLGTVLDAREKKLATGQYDEWANSTFGESGVAYNGEGSIHQALVNEANYAQMQQDYYRQLAADILRGQSGSYGGGYSGGYYGGGYMSGDAPVVRGGASYGGAVTGGGVKVTGGETAGESAVTIPTYTDEEWAKKQNREAARDTVGVTNAATRAPVQGENSSYVQANTERAFDEATRALLEEEDLEAAAAMERARQEYEISGIADPIIPGVVPSETTKVGDEKKTAKTETAGSPVPVTPSVTLPGYSTPGQTGGGYVATDPVYPGMTVQKPGGNVAGQLTDAEIDAILADLGITNVPVFSFAGMEFDDSTLGSQRGDTAVQQAARILSGGGGDGTPNANPNAIPNPVTAPDTVEAAYRATIEDAIRRGDTTSAGALSAALSQYKAEGWKTVPEDQREYYEVLDGNKVVKVPWYNMEEMILAGTAQQRDYPDGSYDFVIRRPNHVKKEV